MPKQTIEKYTTIDLSLNDIRFSFKMHTTRFQVVIIVFFYDISITKIENDALKLQL